MVDRVAPPPSTTTPIAVGLVRCSTDHQEHSVADQKAEIRAWARQSGCRLVEVFEDEGVSGSELDRPGVRQLLAFLERSPQQGTLVVWKRNRLARPDDPRDGLLLERRIERTGWRIHYLHGSQTSGNTLVDTLLGVIEHHQSGEFLRSLATDVLRGQLRRALEGGLLVGVAPYGYAREATTSSGISRVVGRKETYRRAPGESVRWVPGVSDEVETVRWIFERFATDRVSFAGLAGELNADQIPGPRGGPWVDSTLRSLLLNPVYVGDSVWNRTTTSRFVRLIGGKAKRRKKGDGPRCQTTTTDDRVVVPDHHEPLVSRELFEAAGAVLRQRGRRKGGRRHLSRAHPLSGVLFCAQCGSSMTATRFDKRGSVYCCNGYRRSRICQCYLILAPVLEIAVLKKLKQVYAPILSRVGDELHREVLEALREEFGTGAPSAAMARFQREQEALQRKIDQALENMGVVNAQVAARVGAKVEEWSARQREVDAEIAGIQARQVREIDVDRAADEVLEVFRDLAETREDAPREVRHRLFSRTVARIELEFEVDPAKAHRRAGRNRCVGGPITVTPLVEEGASLLPCGSNLVTEAG